MSFLAAIDPEEARRTAQEILSERRFQPSRVPRPFKGIADQLGEWFRPVGEFFLDLFERISRFIPGGDAGVWLVLASLVIAVALFVTLRMSRRRARVRHSSARLLPGAAAYDPDALESAAVEAEAAGDLERAIRLRFRAGLLRLDAARIIDFRDSITSGEISRQLHSPIFDMLARDFDEIVYGRRDPSEEDTARSRDGWSRVIDEVRAA